MTALHAAAKKNTKEAALFMQFLMNGANTPTRPESLYGVLLINKLGPIYYKANCKFVNRYSYKRENSTGEDQWLLYT